MSNLIWLGIAVVLSLIGWTVLWLRNRRPRSTEASVREFSKELEALAPPGRRSVPVRGRLPRSRRSG
ncbi:MAG: hypothetical protein M3179_04260 [Actinomycetota bacterium]|nr:hypothetical protein [Actinomycetota bacterium]